jgi:hypothetical protein
MRRHRHTRHVGFISAIACIALVSAGCSSGGGTPGAVVVPRGGFANDKAEPRTTQWFKSHLQAISALGNLPVISTTQPNYAALSTACVAFSESITVAKSLPPIPDSGAQKLWTNALMQLSAGVTNCSHGVFYRSSRLLKDASSDFTLGHNTLGSLIFGPPKTGTT